MGGNADQGEGMNSRVTGILLLALLVSGVAAAALGFVTSFLVLRGSDLTRLMVTLGVALLLRELANRLGWLTGGADGLQGVNIKPVFGIFRFDMFGHTGYTYCLTVLFILFLIARRLVNSPFGLSLLSVKSNPLRSSAIGIPIDARLVAIYTVAAGYAGIAGALLAQTTAFASLEVFSFDRSADLLLVLIIGGAGYLYGGLIGAVIFKFMQDYLSALTPQYWPFWIGLVLVAIVLVGADVPFPRDLDLVDADDGVEGKDAAVIQGIGLRALGNARGIVLIVCQRREEFGNGASRGRLKEGSSRHGVSPLCVSISDYASSFGAAHCRPGTFVKARSFVQRVAFSPDGKRLALACSDNAVKICARIMEALGATPENKVILNLPATVEGLRKYLGSGLMKGIGPHFAKRLVHESRVGLAPGSAACT